MHHISLPYIVKKIGDDMSVGTFLGIWKKMICGFLNSALTKKKVGDNLSSAWHRKRKHQIQIKVKEIILTKDNILFCGTLRSWPKQMYSLSCHKISFVPINKCTS